MKQLSNVLCVGLCSASSSSVLDFSGACLCVAEDVLEVLRSETVHSRCCLL